MSCRRFAAFAVALPALLAAASAEARPPKPADVPSVEDIYQQARKAIEDAAAKAKEAARDPDKEAIEAYRDRKAPLTDYQRLVDILNDAKTEKLQNYRSEAANALVARFTREDESDPGVRSVRREIAKKLLDLMSASKDDTGLRAVETVFYAWWRAQLTINIKFHATDPLADRKKAKEKMKKFLDKEAN